MNHSALIKKLVLETISEVAPEEELLVEDYEPKSESFGKTARGPQGIGVEAVIVLILPYVYRFFEKFIDRIATNVADDGYKVIKDWFESPQKQSEGQIKSLIEVELSQSGLPNDKVSIVAARILTVMRSNDRKILDSTKQ